MNNKTLYTIAIILIILGSGLLYVAFKQPKASDPMVMTNLETSLEEALGANPSGSDRIHINIDKQNPGKEYIASVQSVNGLSKEEALKTITNYLKTAFIKILEEDIEKVSSVSITLYDPSTNNQYRIILGTKMGKSKNLDFWKEAKGPDIFKWLSEECPKTHAMNFPEFCTISKSIQ